MAHLSHHSIVHVAPRLDLSIGQQIHFNTSDPIGQLVNLGLSDPIDQLVNLDLSDPIGQLVNFVLYDPIGPLVNFDLFSHIDQTLDLYYTKPISKFNFSKQEFLHFGLVDFPCFAFTSYGKSTSWFTNTFATVRHMPKIFLVTRSFVKSLNSKFLPLNNTPQSSEPFFHFLPSQTRVFNSIKLEFFSFPPRLLS